MLLEEIINPDAVLCNAQARSKKHCLEILSELLVRSQADVAPADVFDMLMMVDWPEQLLPRFGDRYPEEALNVVLNIISSPTVIDVLDPE